jgi:hypothetical protein
MKGIDMQALAAFSNFRSLTASEIESVGGGLYWNDTVWDNPATNNTWNHSETDFTNNILMTLSMGMDEQGGFTFTDADRDGFHDSYDYMNNTDDDRPHIHGTDGTVMGQNSDGTWTLYDADGNATMGAWKMTGLAVDTGSGVSGEGGTEKVGFSYSGNGTTYTFVPAG